MKKLIYGFAVLMTALTVLAGCSAGPAEGKTAEKGTGTTMAADRTETKTENSAGAMAEDKTKAAVEAAAENRTEAMAADNPDDKAEYHKISAEEAREMMEEGGVTVVDVRTQEEYDEGHIAGALVVPVETIGEEFPEALADPDAVLLVHCRSGARSRVASEKLIDLGYKNVYDFGGIKDWPYETVKGAE